LKAKTPAEIELAKKAAAHRRKWRRIMWGFHVRAFGEEMARINFMPQKRRKAAVAEMIDYARSKGVKLGRPALGVTP
jgi:hypothetical protein